MLRRMGVPSLARFIRFSSSWSDLEKHFNELKKDGKNTVDSLTQVMKDAKVVGEEVSEDTLKKMMKASNDGKVTLEHFKETLEQVAEKQKRSLSEVLDRVRDAVHEATRK